MMTPAELYQRLLDNIQQVLVGHRTVTRRLLAALIGGGHVLLEDVPGTGKTTLAKALAHSIGADYKRIQFTPDLLPSDILGVSIYDQHAGRFTFHKGPVFTHILLADEINRASPRTQSALLESMAEAQVSVEGVRHALQEPFFVIATQNPVESRGTYPLPEAQMDRFAVRLSLGYVSPEEEVAILLGGATRSPERLTPKAGVEDILRLRRLAAEVAVSDELKRYIVDLVGATRSFPGVEMGASPRASLSLMRTAQALALFDGLGFVTPDLIQEMAVPVIAHRLVLAAQSRFSGQREEEIVTRVMERVPCPS